MSTSYICSTGTAGNTCKANGRSFQYAMRTSILHIIDVASQRKGGIVSKGDGVTIKLDLHHQQFEVNVLVIAVSPAVAVQALPVAAGLEDPLRQLPHGAMAAAAVKHGIGLSTQGAGRIHWC